MIVDDNKSWLQLIFMLKGSSVTHTWPRIFASVAVSVLVTLLHERELINLKVPIVPLTVVGFALGIFLGFRNNEAYNRYWSGRILWGQLVNLSRSFTRQMYTLVKTSPEAGAEEQASLAEFRRAMTLRMAGFSHALRHHLRGTDSDAELVEFFPEAERSWAKGQSNRPLALVHAMGLRLHEAYERGWINDMRWINLDQSLSEAMNIQGGCERIQKTPLPHVYTVLIHRLTAFYCVFLPFGIVSEIHWATPLLTLLVSYALFGLDDIGEELQDPFGTQPNDLPLRAISRGIEINLKQLIEADPSSVPPPLQPVDDFID